jgi:ATP-binding cassette, subfamily B, bacterial
MGVDKSFTTRDKATNRAIHKLFWEGMLKSKGYLILTFLYIVAFFISHIYIPLQVAYALQAIFAQQFEKIDMYLYIIAASGVVMTFCHGLGAWGHNRNGIVACEYVQRKVFENFLDKDYDFYSDQYVGSLGAQATTLRDTCSAYTELIITQVMKSGTIVLGGLSVLAWKSPALAALTLFCMLLILSYAIATSNYRLRYRRQVSTASSELSGVVGDALGHATTVKSFASEDYEKRRLNTSIEKWKTAQLKSWDMFIPANTGRNIINTLTLIILLFATANLYRSGAISLAIVILVQLYMIRLIATTVDIADTLKQYEQIMGTAYQTVKTMALQSSIREIANPKYISKEIRQITFSDITFAYDSDTPSSKAIDTLSLTINSGEKVGFVGYSGSGKTTLTKLVLRFMDTTSGSIMINGVDIRELSQKDLRRHIAYVPQEPLLFHRSIFENIAYGRPNASKKEVLKAAKLAYVDEFVGKLPDKYDTLVGERGIKLSGGQRQRVAIARAILKNAPILVLDEATSALDSRSEQLIQEALWHLMKDRTALVVAHRLSTIQRLDRIVVMDKGKIVEQGKHDELRHGGGIYAELWSHQSGGYLVDKPAQS